MGVSSEPRLTGSSTLTLETGAQRRKRLGFQGQHPEAAEQAGIQSPSRTFFSFQVFVSTDNLVFLPKENVSSPLLVQGN